MNKRKPDVDNLDYFRKKLRKLESEMKKSRRNRSRILVSSSSSSSSSSSRESSPGPKKQQDGTKQTHTATASPTQATMEPATDILYDGRVDEDIDLPDETVDAQPSTSTAAKTDDENPPAAFVELADTAPSDDTFDSILLDILGDDPSSTQEYGQDIQKDLANRVEHLATNGLDSKTRKELSVKYLIPANCTRIAAPLLNAEIKAALPEAMLKRDKSLESRQKQLATAIACLVSAMTDQLTLKPINQDLLRKLMDTARLLCDIQHTDSNTRRNFAMYSVKKDMKEHLSSTKQDKFLFGENLSDALRAAKAVNKSSTELKVPPPRVPKKPVAQATTKPSSKNLNWKAPAPARRTLAPPRSREPASRRAPPAPSSRQLSPPPRPTRRR